MTADYDNDNKNVYMRVFSDDTPVIKSGAGFEDTRPSYCNNEKVDGGKWLRNTIVTTTTELLFNIIFVFFIGGDDNNRNSVYNRRTWYSTTTTTEIDTCTCTENSIVT